MVKDFLLIKRYRNFLYFCAVCGFLGGALGMIIGAFEKDFGVIGASIIVIIATLFLIIFLKRSKHLTDS